MIQNALGLIEVLGMPAALEAADTCVKSANVQLIGYEKVTSGIVTVKIQGDVGAVKSAIDAAKISAGRINTVLNTLVIPRPNEGIGSMIFSEKIERATEIEESISGQTSTSNQESEEVDSEVEIELEESTNKIQLEDSTKNEIEFEDSTMDEENKGLIEIDPSPINAFIEDPQESDEQEEQEEQEDKVSKQKKASCNICKDAKCPREKGQPRNWCIHNGNDNE
ncbi:BMC domain-containing protein [Bacillus marasmi]|uniref:BMC domain-containing protein n=1 Tax=Bacillus marasmi TaxID=1926279 RepID=UPI0011CCDB83|nr:BMC domain-containing protein [Bacillus marasmi]